MGGIILIKKSFVLCLFFSVFSAHAVKIHFPDEELAAESVLPLVSAPEVVLNRNISLKFKTELSFGLGVGLDEPFYNKYYPTGILTFHLTEIHAISLMGAYFFPMRSSGGNCLAHNTAVLDQESADTCLKTKKFDSLLAPYPQFALFLNYQHTPYYGKISLSKSWVLNLSIYGFAGGGLVVSDQNNQWLALDLGFGKKLYFNKWLGFRASLGFFGYYGPKTALLELDRGKVNYNSLTAQQKWLNFNTIVHFGAFVLL